MYNGEFCIFMFIFLFELNNLTCQRTRILMLRDINFLHCSCDVYFMKHFASQVEGLRVQYIFS